MTDRDTELHNIIHNSESYEEIMKAALEIGKATSYPEHCALAYLASALASKAMVRNVLKKRAA